jgi:uncharacterized protein YdeI (YjbR/CyaY-like superfamily)
MPGWRVALIAQEASRRHLSRMADDTPLLFADAPAFRAWLHEHHASSPGIWLRLAKKGARIASVSYAEALEAALCYGWIDSQKKRFDDDTFMQRFTPRGPRSIWSRVNRDKVEALAEAGLMQPAGLRAMEAAKQDGRWDAAYEGSRTITVPEDFQAALDANPKARAFFATLDRTNRYAVLFRIQTATRPATRAARIATITQMLERGETFH